MRLKRHLLMGLAIWLTLIFAVGASNSFAQEADLLDILKRRGVITEEEFQELKGRQAERAAQNNFEVGFDRGFFLRSPDKRHELKFDAQIFEHLTVLPEDTKESTTFRLRRGRVTLSGHLFKDITFKLEFDGTSDPVVDTSAYIGYERFKPFKVRFGQRKDPFGGEKTYSRYKQFFIERSMISDNLTPSTQRGVWLLGDLFNKKLSYDVGITNGAGRAQDNNDDKDYTARLVWRPFRDTGMQDILPLEIGGNFNIGHQPFSSNGARTRLFMRDNRKVIFNASTEGLRVRGGGDVFYNKDYKHGRVSLLGEFIWQQNEREGPVLTGTGTLPKNPDSVIRYGWHLTGGAMLLGSRKKNGLEFVARVEQIDADDSGNNGGADELVGQQLTTYGLGLNFWPYSQLRFLANGFIFDFDRATDLTSADPFDQEGTTYGVIFAAMLKFKGAN